MRYVTLILFILAMVAATAYPACAAAHTFSVSGKIVGGLWQPVEGASVALLDTNGRVIAETRTGTDGSYDFQGLSADTDAYTVKVSFTHDNRTYQAPEGSTRWFRTQKGSTLDPGLTQLKGYFPYPNGFIRGRVELSNDPYRMVNASVYVGSIASMRTVDGSFIFAVPPGTYDVRAIYDTPRGRYVSDTMKVAVSQADSIQEVAPITLVLMREGIAVPDPVEFLLSLILGLACLGGECLVLKKL